jgi:4-fold beta-flower domain-containing protein
MTPGRGTGRRVTRGFVTLHMALEPDAHLEAIVDADGDVCGWMLPDRVVGRHGAAQAWLLDGAVYSLAGTHIGSLQAGVFRGEDGTISGRLRGSHDLADAALAKATLPAPPAVPAARRPVLRPSFDPRGAPRDEWSSYGWSGFLIPRPPLPAQETVRMGGRPALSPVRVGSAG